MKKVLVVLLLIWVATPYAVVFAQQPMEALRVPIDHVVGILKDPQYDDPAKKSIEREKLWAVIQSLFDFTEMSKRTLAQSWKDFAPQERKEFAQVFGEFLGNTYLDKIQKDYQDEQVVYLKEEMVSDDKAVVPTKVIRENLDIPIEYSMILNNGNWQVYDVKIEGVSLVKNYRTQFAKILMKDSPKDLIDRLKKKVEKQRQGEKVSEEAALGNPYCGYYLRG